MKKKNAIKSLLLSSGKNLAVTDAVKNIQRFCKDMKVAINSDIPGKPKDFILN